MSNEIPQKNNNMLVLLRQEIAMPPIEEAMSPTDSPVDATLEAEPLPTEARTGKSLRRVWNRRRQADPLGEGHAATWRMRLIKVAVRIRVTARRIRVFISGSWPFLDHFREVGRAVLEGS